MKSRDELPVFFKQRGYEVGAEIGVYRGEFTEKFCKEGLKMYAVDSWLARGRQSQKLCNLRYEFVEKLLSKYDCKIIRKISMDAVKDFEDESLDFVYIDADHRYGFVYQDVLEWTKKVRKGGIVSGHDYNYHDTDILSQAGQAVELYIKENNLKLFTLGENERVLSWYFIK